jgi:hypothetical protein
VNSALPSSEPANDHWLSDQPLEPPGTIAVIGGGPLGIEAALYGRFLGYNVSLFEAESIGHSLEGDREEPLPMLPDRCLSPLALSAINAQDPEGPPFVLPTTVGQWIDTVMVGLKQTDLLRGRVHFPARVTQVDQLEIQREDGDDLAETLPPPDFRLTIQGRDFVDCEAVIVAIGDSSKLPISFSAPCPYFFCIGEERSGNAERDLMLGLKQIADIYAKLADRETLDLYRPVRGADMIIRRSDDVSELSDEEE